MDDILGPATKPHKFGGGRGLVLAARDEYHGPEWWKCWADQLR